MAKVYKPKVQPAELSDLAELKDLLDKANEYSASLAGSPAWVAINRAYTELEYRLQRGEWYVIRNSAGEITSAIIISDRSREGSKGDNALYFYKLIKDPAKATPGEGVRLLHFAAEQAIKHGKFFLRCDTGAELDHLINYYVKYGFAIKDYFHYQPSDHTGITLEGQAKIVLDKTAPY